MPQPKLKMPLFRTKLPKRGPEFNHRLKPLYQAKLVLSLKMTEREKCDVESWRVNKLWVGNCIICLTRWKIWWSLNTTISSAETIPKWLNRTRGLLKKCFCSYNRIWKRIPRLTSFTIWASTKKPWEFYLKEWNLIRNRIMIPRAKWDSSKWLA